MRIGCWVYLSRSWFPALIPIIPLDPLARHPVCPGLARPLTISYMTKVILEDGIDCYKANEGRASQWPASGWKFSWSAAHLDTILSREIVKKTFPEVMGPFLMCAIIESGCFISSEAFR